MGSAFRSPTYQDPVERTLPALLEARAADCRDQVLALFPDRQLTYRDVAERARLFAGALQKLGVGKGDTVAIIVGNRWEYLEIWFGICLLGAIEVPVNHGLKGKLLQHVLHDSRAKVLVVEAEYLQAMEGAIGPESAVGTIIVLDERPRMVADRPAVAFDAMPRCVPVLPEVRYGDVAAIMYTSGSTGPAKGVVLSHNYFLRFGEEKVKHLRTGPNDRIYNCYPLFNASGQLEAVVTAMLAGASVFQARRFSASRFWQEIRAHHCTEFIYMGGILSVLAKADPSPDDADNPIRAGYGAPTPGGLHPVFEQRFGCALVEVYGSTEANTVTFNPYDARKWGSCGLPSAGYVVRLVDEDDNEVGPGEVGEMLVRPEKAHSIFEGYWGLPNRTAEAFRGLWYRTGDLLRRDEDGYFFFVARKGDAIRHRGYLFNASQVEDVVNGFEGVHEAAVVGLENEQGEEDVKLVATPRPGARLDPAALRAECERALPFWMVPRYIEIRGELPKTPTQRVEKYRLREEGVPADGSDFGPFRPNR